MQKLRHTCLGKAQLNHVSYLFISIYYLVPFNKVFLCLLRMKVNTRAVLFKQGTRNT